MQPLLGWTGTSSRQQALHDLDQVTGPLWAAAASTIKGWQLLTPALSVFRAQAA